MRPRPPLPAPRTAQNGEECARCGATVTADTAHRLPARSGSWRTEHLPEIDCQRSPQPGYEQHRARLRGAPQVPPAPSPPPPPPPNPVPAHWRPGPARITATRHGAQVVLEEVEMRDGADNTTIVWWLHTPGSPPAPYTHPTRALEAFRRWRH